MVGKILNQFIFQFGNYILPFLIIPFLINKLSLNVYKDFVIIQTLVIFFAVLLNYGLDLFGVRYISTNKYNKKKCEVFLIISIISRLLVFLIASIFLIISLSFLTQLSFVYWSLSFFWLSSFVIQLNWYFQGMGDFNRITLYGLFPKLILYPFVFIFVKGNTDAWIYLFLCGLANYISNLSMLVHLFITFETVRIPIKRLKIKVLMFFKRGWYIFLSQASVSLISYANVFILPLILDTKSFVVFSTADRIVKVLSITTTPILNVLFPYISELVHKDKIRAFSIISRVSVYSIFIFIFCYSIYIYCGGDIIMIVFPKVYNELNYALSFLLFNVIFVFLNNLYGTQIGLNMGKDKSFSRIILFNGVLSICLMIALGYFQGLHGTIITSVLVQISVLLSMFILAKKCGYKFKVK